jgi:hypothetical protein
MKPGTTLFTTALNRDVGQEVSDRAGGRVRAPTQIARRSYRRFRCSKPCSRRYQDHLGLGIDASDDYNMPWKPLLFGRVGAPTTGRCLQALPKVREVAQCQSARFGGCV